MKTATYDGVEFSVGCGVILGCTCHQGQTGSIMRFYDRAGPSIFAEINLAAGGRVAVPLFQLDLAEGVAS